MPDVYLDIMEERRRQEAKWGEQNHPNADPAVLKDAVALCRFYKIPTEQEAKDTCEARAREGKVTWADITLEEFSESFEALAQSEEVARTELVQLAAVVVSWIECIDRRAGKETRQPTSCESLWAQDLRGICNVLDANRKELPAVPSDSPSAGVRNGIQFAIDRLQKLADGMDQVNSDL